MTQLTKLQNLNITINDVVTKEYRLMYQFGAWITKEIICAENDYEAIFDSDAAYSESRLQNWQHGVALWCGNRKVKTYR